MMMIGGNETTVNRFIDFLDGLNFIYSPKSKKIIFIFYYKGKILNIIPKIE